MYLSIGNDMAVRSSEIIGIFDMDNTTTSARTRDFLRRAQQEGMVVSCDGLPKSFLLTTRYAQTYVYESPMTPATLEKRMK